MGNPLLTTAQLVEPADRQRLVVVSPFFLDETEVTVARFRASGLAAQYDPAERPSAATGNELEDWCTYTETAGDTDALPVNCVSWGKARAYCISVGKDLVTEAQYEYVAGALRSWDFVWGHDEPSCADAVFGRGGHGVLAPLIAPCKPPVGIGGPLPAGSGAWDALTLPSGAVLDLAGNLSEQTLDLWNSQDEPCWSAGLLYDPICTQPGAIAPAHAARGGNWAMLGLRLQAAGRGVVDEGDLTPFFGFRCARPGR
jgi:formylglycine-generating enzyme required for sulfatase activity